MWLGTVVPYGMQFRQTLIAIFLILVNPLANAQDQQSITGEYSLEGVMETASGFRLNPDSSFEYFFSQGALDRYGKGRWILQNGSLILNSRPWPGSDFKWIKSYRELSPYTKVQLIDSNTSLLSFFDVLLIKDGKVSEASMNQQGVASLRLTGADSILLQCRFCPERYSAFPIPDKTHTVFQFSMESWMLEVFLKDFRLEPKAGGLTGANPLLMGSGYHYRKVSE